MPIPKIIHFALPKNISENQNKNVESAKKILEEYNFKIWKDPIKEDEFQLSKYWGKVNSGAQLADLVRIEAVYNHGGIYIDSDVIVHKKFDQFLDEQFFIASEDGKKLTNAVFGAEKGSKVLEKLIKKLKEEEPDWSKPPDVTTGPRFFSRELKWNEDVKVLPKDTFYTYNWNEKKTKKHPASTATHEWNGSWLKDNNNGSKLDKVREYAGELKNKLKGAVKNLIPKNKNITNYNTEGIICTETEYEFRILLPGSDLSITPEIISKGRYEPREEKIIRRKLRGGDFFIDVGANVGLFSLLAATQVGPFGRVFSIEPNPKLTNLIRKSASMNWMHDRIKIKETAISDEQNEKVLEFSNSRIGDGHIQGDTGQEPLASKTALFLDQSSKVKTKVNTLDNIFEKNVPIRFLKVDVEGLEAEVLDGASRLIKNKCIDYILIEVVYEVNPQKFEKTISRIKRMCKKDYECYTILNDGDIEKIEASEIKHKNNTRNVVLKAGWVKK